MKCPFCGNEETQVRDTRIYNDGLAIKRRRICNNCGNKFSTLEEVIKKEIFVIKKDGSKQLFDKYKLKNSIRIGCGKRITDDSIELVLSNVINILENLQESEITSKQVGDTVLQELKKIDKVAFIRFASVYMNFETENDYKNFIKQLEE